PQPCPQPEPQPQPCPQPEPQPQPCPQPEPQPQPCTQTAQPSPNIYVNQNVNVEDNKTEVEQDQPTPIYDQVQEPIQTPCASCGNMMHGYGGCQSCGAVDAMFQGIAGLRGGYGF
ncbi:hypothetical protein K502DRAFT_349388, partial [Neoconidiobolus thromboides FSU 785]